MLITRSTPRITYKIGTRAWLDLLADKSLPLFGACAKGEVAAAVTGIFKSLTGNHAEAWKTAPTVGYESTSRDGTDGRLKMLSPFSALQEQHIVTFGIV